MGQESRVRQLTSPLRYKHIGTAFQVTLKLWIILFSTDYITNMSGYQKLHESLRTTGLAGEPVRHIGLAE